MEQPTAKIRDTSRSRLQRLGALYANPNELSSPIHRTEGDFRSDSPVDECDGKCTKRSKQRLGKLVELASSINRWEDDTGHHDPHPVSSVPPPKPALPSRIFSNVPVATLQDMNSSNNTCKGHERTISGQLSSMERKTAKAAQPPCSTKQLTWDPLLFNSLEAQGFQRRKSSAVKIAYDYSKDEDCKPMEKQGYDNEKNASYQPKVAKLASTFSKILEDKYNMVDYKERKFTDVNVGLVSGRTAAFEKKVSACQEEHRPQKDPIELSIKERMQLFERNKGEALVPKAALGMAPSITKIQDDHIVQHKGDGAKATNADMLFPNGNLNLKSSKPSSENKLREKVAALVSKTSTISEGKIRSDIQKQRHEDMQVIANRFHKQKNINENNEDMMEVPVTKESLLNVPNMKNTNIAPTHPPSPPPPPPMPKESLTVKNKRHSPSEVIDEESKRARKSTMIAMRQEVAVNRLYPALLDLETKNLASESNRDSDATTANMSGHSTADEHHRMLTKEHEIGDLDSMNGDGRDGSGMCSEATDDSSIDISLGREIMHDVQKNDDPQQKLQRNKRIEEQPYGDNEYLDCEDSSLNSSETSLGVNDYLDEALEEDDTQGSDNCADDCESIFHQSKENKGTTASNSFSFHKSSKKYKNYKITTKESKISSIQNSTNTMYMTQPVKSEMSINRENDNSMVTLVHTVSFYRRQQSDNSANSTPIGKVSKERKILRSDISNATTAAMKIGRGMSKQEVKNDQTFVVEEVEKQVNRLHDEIDTDDTHLVEEKIKKLLDEVCKQQTVISQTSQALNLCAATIEFSGSTESVEGERHLLVASKSVVFVIVVAENIPQRILS